MHQRILGMVIVASTIAAGQQVSPSPVSVRADAAISGVVIDGVTKQPIEDAIVQLGWIDQSQYPELKLRQFTDANGRYVFTDLPARSTYVVRVNKPGYFNNSAGSTGEEAWTERAINLADGQWIPDANVTLWPPASISGTVMDESGEPVIGVFVRALTAIRVAGADHWAVGQVTLTDDRGMYRIGQLHTGRYVVMVPSAQASVPASATSPALLGLAKQDLVSLQNGERPPMVPLPSLVDVDTTTRLALIGYPVPPPAVGGRFFTYPIAFAGSTSLAQATVVAVRAGDDRTGVDVRLDPVPAVRISGVVDGLPEARANLAMRLVPDGLEGLGGGGVAATTVTREDGSFAFALVPAGHYTLEAPIALSQYTIGNIGIFYGTDLPRPLGIASISSIGEFVSSMPGIGFTAATTFATRFVQQPIALGAEDQAGIVVRLQPTIRMSGRLVGEADPRRPAPAAQPRFVDLQSVTGSPRLGNPHSINPRNLQPGEFAIEGIMPGTYLLRSNGETDWMVKSVVVGGRDYTYAPIDVSSGDSFSDVVVTFTNAIPTVSGTVSDSSGARSGDAAVIAFPVETEQWTNYGLNPVRVKSARTSTNGSFRLQTLPAGTYYLIAVDASRAYAWREPDFFKTAQPLATKITIGWGEAKTVDLRVANVR